jgi:dTDP-glucose 4,6-dehydratase
LGFILAQETMDSSTSIMSRRRYFGTGLTGFIGKSIVNELLKREDTESVTLLTRKPSVSTIPMLDYLIGDITEVEFPEESFTDVIHAAAEANDLLAPDKPAYYYALVEGANRIFDWANRIRPKRMLFVSSGAVAKGDSVYCRAKRMSERIMPQWCKVARVYCVAGQGMPIDGQYAIGRFIGDALYRKKVSFYESGSIRSYLNVDDCANWLLTILEGGFPYYPYDVGSERAITIRELAHLVANIAGVLCEEIERNDYHQTAQVYLPKLSNTLKLGCKETIDLETSIEQAFIEHGHTHLEPEANP